MARSGVKPVVEAGKAKRRARHSLKAGAGRGGRRGVLKTLQPHATDPKFLVGAGSPRSAAIKAGKKTVRGGRDGGLGEVGAQGSV